MGRIRNRGKPRDDKTVRIDRKLCKKGELVAKARGISLAEYFSEILRPTVDRDSVELGEKLISDHDDEESGGPPGDPCNPTPAAGEAGPRFLNPNPGPVEPGEPGKPPGKIGPPGGRGNRKRERPEDSRGAAS